MRRMPRAANSWIGLGIAGAGVALSFAYPVAAVAVAFAGVVFSLPMSFNVPSRRLAHHGALVCYAATIYLGSRSLALAAVPLPFAPSIPPSELVIKRPASLSWAPPLCIGASLALFALAWPTGSWGFAVAPCLLGLLPFAHFSSFSKAVRAFDDRPKLPKVGQPMPPLALPRR